MNKHKTHENQRGLLNI